MITSKLVYLYDTKFRMQKVERIEDLNDVLLIKTNPSVF